MILRWIERFRARRGRAISANEFREPRNGRDGRALVAAMQASPVADIDIEPARAVMPVRDVIL